MISYDDEIKSRASQKVTMDDIAKKLGITKVSVSKAINNQPGLSDKLREEIIKLANEVGYTKGKVNSPVYNLAFISPKRFFLEDDTFYTTIYYYINKHCINTNDTLRCFVINNDQETKCEIPSQLYRDAFDGIFLGGQLSSTYLERLKEIKSAFVAIDFYSQDFDADCIITDNYYMGFRVTNYLIKHGHKKIGFVGDITQTSSICDRYFGYLKALRLAGLSSCDDWVLINSNAVTGDYIVDINLPREIPTAFVCHCDKAAFMLIQTLENSGIRVPADVSVISFDNTSICEMMSPKLTSVEIDRKLIANQSMRLMQARISNPNAPYQKIYNNSVIIERSSVEPTS